MANGGTLTINPQTGLPEAGFLDSLLPALAGFALNAFLPGVGGAIGSALGFGAEAASAVGSGLLVGGATGLATGSLEKGLMAGLGAYGGAGLAGSLSAAGEAAAMGPPTSAMGLPEGAAVQAASPAGTLDRLQAGTNIAMNAPRDFLKDNAWNFGFAAAPGMSGAFDDQTSSAPKIHPGYIRKYDKDPVTGTLYQVSATPADQYTGGINFGGVPEIEGVPPVRGYAQGGLPRGYLSTDEYGREFGDPYFGQPSDQYEGITIQGGNDEYGNLNGSDAARRAMLGQPSSLARPDKFPDMSIPLPDESPEGPIMMLPYDPPPTTMPSPPENLPEEERDETSIRFVGVGQLEPSKFSPEDLALSDSQRVQNYLMGKGPNPFTVYHKEQKIAPIKKKKVEEEKVIAVEPRPTGGGGDGGGRGSGGFNSDGGGSAAGKAARDGSGFGGTGSGVGGDGGGNGNGNMGGPNGGGFGPTGGNAGARGGYLDHGKFIQRYDEGGTTKTVNFGGVGQLEPVNTSASDALLSDSQRTQNYLMGNGPNPFAFHYSNEKKVVPATKASDNTGIAAIGGTDLVNDNVGISRIGNGNLGSESVSNGFVGSGAAAGSSISPDAGANNSINPGWGSRDAGGGTPSAANPMELDPAQRAQASLVDMTSNSLTNNPAVGEIGDFTGDTNSSVFGVTNQPDDATSDINNFDNNTSAGTVNTGDSGFYTGSAGDGMDNVDTSNPEIFSQEYVDPRADPFEAAERLEQSEMNEGYFGGFDNGSGSDSDSGGNFGSGFDSGGGCPAPWINITLSDGGTVKAGDIKPGMMVYTRHETTGEWGNFPVTVVRNGEDNRWTILFESGIEFVGTFNHPVRVDDAWVEIQHLKAGDKVVQPEGFAVVKSAKYFDHGPIVKIEVQDAHTYLTEGFLSHNKNMADYDFGNMRTEGFEFDDADFYADGGTTGSGSIDLHVPINIGGGGGGGGSFGGGFGGGQYQTAGLQGNGFGNMSQPDPDFLSKQQESLPGYIAMQKSQQDYNNSDEFKNFKNYAQEYQRQFQPQQKNSAFGGGMGGGRGDLRQDQRMYPMAEGGIAALAQGGYNLGSYSDGGRLLRGPGDGVSDSIPATIGRNQPARLADGEFVVPARIVSELGNGSTEAGARKLYAMMDRVQKSRAKTTGKNKIAANSRADKYLPA
jgi:hypothetical protein